MVYLIVLALKYLVVGLLLFRILLISMEIHRIAKSHRWISTDGTFFIHACSAFSTMSLLPKAYALNKYNSPNTIDNFLNKHNTY